MIIIFLCSLFWKFEGLKLWSCLVFILSKAVLFIKNFEGVCLMARLSGKRYG